MGDRVTRAQIEGFPCFRDLREADFAAIERVIRVIRVRDGEALFHQDDTGDGMYLLLAGEVEIKIDLPGPDDHLLARLNPGTIFGEIALLLDSPRTASAFAVGETTLLLITRTDFQKALEREAHWATALLKAVADVLALRLATLDREVVALREELRECESTLSGGARRAAELDDLRKRLLAEWSF